MDTVIRKWGNSAGVRLPARVMKEARIGATSSGSIADQVKSLDWVARSAKYQAKADPGVVQEVRAKLAVLI